ncbi:MAG TPA: hypothetical protein VGB77_08685 [Abditibacteriaceae bacterium]|jgi:hypothetical protein
MKKQRKFKIVKGNKYEIYISLILPFVTTPYYAVLPRGYTDILIGIAVFTIAFLCALNSILDIGRMHWLERLIAVPWFCLLTFYLPLAIWSVAHIRAFSSY